MERKFANYGNFLPILTKIQLCLELKYKILAIIKNVIKNKETTGVPTSYQSRYFINLD